MLAFTPSLSSVSGKISISSSKNVLTTERLISIDSVPDRFEEELCHIIEAGTGRETGIAQRMNQAQI